jgi:hypothetical protein
VAGCFFFSGGGGGGGGARVVERHARDSARQPECDCERKSGV